MTDENKLLRSSSIDYTPDRLSQGYFNPQEYPLVCMDCANNLIMDGRVLVKRDEYERLKALEAENARLKTENENLKKLDENVKNKIKELEIYSNEIVNIPIFSTDSHAAKELDKATYEINVLKELLESLYE